MSRNGSKNKEIADVINVDPGTISREFSRNGGKSSYDCYYAQARYDSARKVRPKYKLTPELWEIIKSRLELKDSPEQIAAYLKAENLPSLSHEWIYQNVYSDKKAGGTLYTNLRRGRKRRRKRLNSKDRRGIIPNRTFISSRPKHINEKKEYGHWEGDTIVGKDHKSSALVLVERKSKFSIIRKLKSATKEEVAGAILKLHKERGFRFKSITVDNGHEFSAHEKIAKAIKGKIYFADPYSPWQRGLCENTNGLIRQFIPKSTNIDAFSNKEIQRIEDNLNNRTRKLLKFKAPKSFINKLAFRS